jgi:hypothetical protein
MAALSWPTKAMRLFRVERQPSQTSVDARDFADCLHLAGRARCSRKGWAIGTNNCLPECAGSDWDGGKNSHVLGKLVGLQGRLVWRGVPLPGGHLCPNGHIRSRDERTQAQCGRTGIRCQYSSGLKNFGKFAASGSKTSMPVSLPRLTHTTLRPQSVVSGVRNPIAVAKVVIEG